MPELLEELAARVERNPIAVLRLDLSEWNALRESRRGVGEFTTAFPHADFAQLKAPTFVCCWLKWMTSITPISA